MKRIKSQMAEVTKEINSSEDLAIEKTKITVSDDVKTDSGLKRKLFQVKKDILNEKIGVDRTIVRGLLQYPKRTFCNNLNEFK